MHRVGVGKKEAQWIRAVIKASKRLHKDMKDGESQDYRSAGLSESTWSASDRTNEGCQGPGIPR